MKTAICSSALALLLFCSAAFAAEADGPLQLMESKMNEVLLIVNNPDFKDKQQNPPLMLEIKDKIYTVCDFEELSHRAVGGAWRAFTPEQKSKFIDAFKELVYTTYHNKLLDYHGQRFTFKREQFNSAKTKAEVVATFPLEKNDAQVNFRMLKKPDGWKIYDIIIEDLQFSLVQHYSTQFKEILKNGNADSLISALQKQNLAIAEKE
jgi:phospholipid transport system substrate-binding protein